MRRLFGLISIVLIISMLLSSCSLYVPSSIVFAPVDQREHINTKQPEHTAEPHVPASEEPTLLPTAAPTPEPTSVPTSEPTLEPTPEPTPTPTPEPTPAPTPEPTPAPTPEPTPEPTEKPTAVPTSAPVTSSPTTAPSGTKYVYLTFDDGPCANTLRVIEILERYNVKATFFTVGYFVDRNPDIAREIVASGNLIACHSYTHDFTQCYASADAMMAEVERWERAVLNAVGYLPWRICFRFPGGSSTGSAKPHRDRIISLLHQRGYEWFDWNAGNNDKWPGGNTENLPFMQYLISSYDRSLGYQYNQGTKNVIILCHDTVNETVEMLPYMIEDLIARGYEFRVLSQHPKWNS